MLSHNRLTPGHDPAKFIQYIKIVEVCSKGSLSDSAGYSLTGIKPFAAPTARLVETSSFTQACLSVQWSFYFFKD